MFRIYTSLLALIAGLSQAQDTQCLQSHLVKISTQSEFDFQGKSVTRHKLESYLSTKPLTLSTSKEGSQWWGIQMTDVKQIGNGEAMPEDMTYTLPFAVLRATKGERIGEILQFKFPVNLTENEQNKLKGLAYYLQFAEPATSKPVERNEQDTIGTFNVTYQRELSTGATQNIQFQKTKSHYLNMGEVNTAHQSNNAVNTVEVLNSEQIITPSSCWFESIRGKESLEILGAAQAYTMNTQQAYSLIKVAKPVPSLLAQLPNDIAKWQVGEEVKPLTEQELLQLSIEFKAQLNQLPIMEFKASDLAKWLEKFEPVIADLEKMLEDGLFPDDVNKRLFNALGHLDSPNGNRLLVTLMQNTELSETERFRAMRAITTGTSPLSESLTEQMLEILNDENFKGTAALRGSAIMAIGAVINRRQPNEFSNKLLTELSNKVSPSAEPSERAALIAGLGNAGKVESLDLLSQYQNDETPQVRANVATSLGQIGNEQAHQQLSNMLQSESDQRAQQAIFSAMGQFELSAQDINTMTQKAQSSKSERTRGQAIRALSNQTHRAQLAKASLRSMMKTEKSRKNFTQAAKALTKLNQQTGN